MCACVYLSMCQLKVFPLDLRMVLFQEMKRRKTLSRGRKWNFLYNPVMRRDMTVVQRPCGQLHSLLLVWVCTTLRPGIAG